MKWKELAKIQIGGAICLPVLLVGFELGRLLSKGEALLAIFIGNLFLTLLAIPIANFSAKSRLTTSESMELIFGSIGSKITAVLLSSCLLVWFSIQTQLIVDECAAFIDIELSSMAWYLLITAVAGLTFMTTYRGIQAIGRLATYATPILCLTLGLAFCLSEGSPPPTTSFSIYSGIVMIIGTAIFAVIDLPTYFREATNVSESSKGAVASFLIGLTLVEGVGAMLSHPAKSLLESLSISSNILWSIWLLLFIFIAGWTTNVANLYSGAQAMRTLCTSMSKNGVLILTGSIGLFFCFLPTLGDIPIILDLFASTIIALGSVLLITCLGMPLSHLQARIALLIGTSLGVYEWMLQSSISGIAMLDVLCITSFAALTMSITFTSQMEQTT